MGTAQMEAIYLILNLIRSLRQEACQTKIPSIKGLSCAETTKFMHTDTKTRTPIYTILLTNSGLRNDWVYEELLEL